ncbi:hypothetical protein U1Q18_052804 [Sarracenia purpurea var. burkii]
MMAGQQQNSRKKVGSWFSCFFLSLFCNPLDTLFDFLLFASSFVKINEGEEKETINGEEDVQPPAPLPLIHTFIMFRIRFRLLIPSILLHISSLTPSPSLYFHKDPKS